MDWLPIESAPRDETLILICNDRHQHFMVRAAYYDPETPSHPWFVEDSCDGFGHAEGWPTHWMPLPNPPSGGRK